MNTEKITFDFQQMVAMWQELIEDEKKKFLYAFIQETGLKPTDAVMNVQTTKDGFKIWYEQRSEKIKIEDTWKGIPLSKLTPEQLQECQDYVDSTMGFFKFRKEE